MAKRVLIIEDERNIRELYRTILESESYEVDEAEEGQEGFRKASTEDYDVIISDLKMPNWDGVDAIKSLGLVKPTARFIVCTGYIESDLGQEVHESTNVITMLSKPVDIQVLLDAVKNA